MGQVEAHSSTQRPDRCFSVCFTPVALPSHISFASCTCQASFKPKGLSRIGSLISTRRLVSLKKMYLTRASFPSLSLSSALSYVSHSFPFLPQYIVSSPISRLLFRHFHPECAVSSVSRLTCFWLVWKLSRVEVISLLKFQLTDFRNASPCTANENGIWMSLKSFCILKLK